MDTYLMLCDIITIEIRSYNNWLEDSFINVMSIDDLEFKLRHITSVEYKDRIKYTCIIYSCNGNKEAS